MTKSSGWAPKNRAPKKTSIGNGPGSKFKSLASQSKTPKGYRKKYRGQGKKR
jgi:hypothetical protein